MWCLSSISSSLFLSTPSARRATREGARICWMLTNFYPRPPRGGRQQDGTRENILYKFLSTPSARRATAAFLHTAAERAISIHALREEGDVIAGAKSVLANISIHALREEGDLRHEEVSSMAKAFLSTPSARRATQSAENRAVPQAISIHALREEGDKSKVHS